GERKRRRGGHRRSRAAKMTNQPRTVANKVMILPTESGYTDDNAHNLWKRASNLRKRSPHMGVICSRTCRPKTKPTNDGPPWRSIMKKLIAVLTIVTLMAVPTFVQSVSAAPVSPSSSTFGGNGY